MSWSLALATSNPISARALPCVAGSLFVASFFFFLKKKKEGGGSFFSRRYNGVSERFERERPFSPSLSRGRCFAEEVVDLFEGVVDCDLVVFGVDEVDL